MLTQFADRLLDSEEHACESAIPPVAEETSEFLRHADKVIRQVIANLEGVALHPSHYEALRTLIEPPPRWAALPASATVNTWQHNGAVFKAVEQNGCNGCAFNAGREAAGLQCRDAPRCSTNHRADGRGVIWVQTNKGN